VKSLVVGRVDTDLVNEVHRIEVEENLSFNELLRILLSDYAHRRSESTVPTEAEIETAEVL
jgi:hypothetical protein